MIRSVFGCRQKSGRGWRDRMPTHFLNVSRHRGRFGFPGCGADGSVLRAGIGPEMSFPVAKDGGIVSEKNRDDSAVLVPAFAVVCFRHPLFVVALFAVGADLYKRGQGYA